MKYMKSFAPRPFCIDMQVWRGSHQVVARWPAAARASFALYSLSLIAYGATAE